MKIKLKQLSAGYKKNNIRTHFHKFNSPDKIVREMYNGWIKFNIIMDIEDHHYATSITLKKNIVSLWLVMMDKIHCDHNRVIIDFIQKVCLPRWRGDTAKGLGDFVLKCMLHSILDKDDWLNFKTVYMSLNGRVKNPNKLINTKHGEGCIKCRRKRNVDVIKERIEKIKRAKENPELSLTIRKDKIAPKRKRS